MVFLKDDFHFCPLFWLAFNGPFCLVQGDDFLAEGHADACAAFFSCPRFVNHIEWLGDFVDFLFWHAPAIILDGKEIALAGRMP